MRAIWLFICAVTAIDVVYTWFHRGTIGVWEANPVQQCLAMNGGILLVLLFRACTVLFGMVVIPMGPRRLKLAGETILVVSHAYLLVLYLDIFLGTGV